MPPARDDHVDLDVWLLSILRAFVEHSDLGAVRGPELAVRLSGQRRRRVRDVLFISRDRLDIIRATHVERAPDFIMEIVSPDSQSRDGRKKYLEHEAAGVREYCIFDPAARRAEAYRLANARYARIADAGDRIASAVLHGFFNRPLWLAGEKLPKLMDVLVELNVVRPNAKA